MENESVGKNSNVLLTHLTKTQEGGATFYYIIDPIEDIEILETVRLSNPRLNENHLVCKVRIKPYNHVRWTWFSFLSEECVRRSSEKLIEDAREAAEILNELREFLSSSEKLSKTKLKFLSFTTELSFGLRKKKLAQDLAKSLALIPIPNAVVERSIYFLLRQIEKFNEEIT